MRWGFLASWWNREFEDNATTSDPRWRQAGSGPPAGYRLVGLEGQLVTDLLEPDARGYHPLWRYHSRERRDHFTTSHPSWTSSTVGGYRRVRREGMVLSEPYAGTTPLTSWWSARRQENFTTSSGTWHQGAPDIPDEYAFVRVEGHVRPQSHLPVEDPGRVGYRSREARGRRDLLVIVNDYANRSVPSPTSFWRTFAAGPDAPHLKGYFAAISHQRFALSRVVVVRVRHGRTFADATSDAGVHDRAAVARAALETDLSVFDRDGDGRVTGDDLIVLSVVADGSALAQRRVVNGAIGGLSFEGVTFIGFGSRGDLRLAAHEIMHLLEPDQHNYGPLFALNARASLFASGGTLGTRTAGPVDLDPWNKQLLGWVEPRLIAIGRAGGTAALPAAQLVHGRPREGPLVFYDPRRGTDELLLVEYRNPTPDGAPFEGVYDSQVADQGIAVWYVKRRPAGTARAGLGIDFTWPTRVVPTRDGPVTQVIFDQPLVVTPTSPANATANFLIGPRLYGGAPFWKNSDGTMMLRWADGTDTGLRMRVAPLGPRDGVAYVQWWHARQPFLPRLDRCAPTELAAGSDARVVLEGMFPLEHVQVRLRAPSGRGHVVAQPVVRGVGTRLPSVLSVPDSPGPYLLSVHRSDGSASNEVPIVIR